ncbi:MAG: hypothetical protein AB8B50_13215 [Pirellulaceae bacterium]
MDGLSALRSSRGGRTLLHAWACRNSPTSQMRVAGVSLLLCLVAPSGVALLAKQPDITFDVPTLACAQMVDPASIGSHAQDGSLVRIQIPVSAYIEPRFQGTVSEYVVQIESPLRTLQVRDYWPRRESVTNVAGNVRVEQSNQSESKFGAKASGGFAVVANGTLEASHRSNSTTKETYERLPESQSVALAGHANRGAGVFFKFRAGHNVGLEGARETALLAQVPKVWRADKLLVTVKAFGTRHARNTFSGFTELASTQCWVAVFREGDTVAKARAQDFVRLEQQVRDVAVAKRKDVERASHPTIFHQIGAAMSVVEPRIPEDYVQQVLFGPRGQYLEGHSHRLPLDLRIAILDFWEGSDGLSALATGESLDKFGHPLNATTELLTSS